MCMLKGMRGNGIFLLIFALQGISVAQAQDVTTVNPSVNSIVESLQYTSVFKNYQPYSEEEIIPWKQANATVERIGGWKAYAKEAAQAHELPVKESNSKSHHEGVK